MNLDAAAVVEDEDDTPEVDEEGHDDGLETYVALTSVEEQFLLENYSMEETLFKDYVELMIQFGYATLFSAAFPLAPLLALINNYVELRVDAWKLCQQTKRAEPLSAETIGTWQAVVGAMSQLAVQSNALLVCFTGIFFDDLAVVHRLAFFLLFEHVVMFAKFIVSYFSSTTDPHVEMQLARGRFILSKVLLNVADEAADVEDYLPDWEPILTSVQPDFRVHLRDENLEREAFEMAHRLEMQRQPDRAAV